MKNVVILGVPRAGKSTLTRMIRKECNKYQVITGDAVRKAFTLALPKNDINSHNGKGMEKDFPLFLRELFYQEIIKNRNYSLFILDTCDISPKQAYELFDMEKYVMLFLGYPNIKFEEKMKEIRKYETEDDWTKRKTNERVEMEIKTALEKSIRYEQECKDLGIRYIDTSYNREEVLNKLVKELLEN